jgi:uncharacterized protein (TIGR03546 family)
MWILRKIGSVLRGRVTPLQLMLATTLGGILGFVPGFFLPGDLGGGFLQAPGLIVLLLCCVLVLNANLGVFGLVTLGCKALSVVMLPVSYALGTWLLDGPLQGLFRALINGKVTAWCGFEYYATAGGLVFGLVFGLGSGLLFNRTIGSIRTKMASVEESSELYQKYAQKKWVRFCTWLLLGKGKGKKDWKDLSEQGKVGMPVRIWGVASAVVLVGSLWVFQQWFSTPILTSNTRGALEWMNGATVDLAAAKLDFGEGTLRFSGLAIADSKALDTDLFAADELTATLDTGELLRKRLVIDELRSTSARSGSPRSKKGVILPTKPPPPEPPPPPTNTKTIEDYLADFQVWKQRLEQAREWIDVIAGGDEQPPAEQTPEQRKEDRAEQARVHGIASVVATHLIEAGPRVLIRKIDIEGIGYTLNGKPDKLDLRARNLSDIPSLVPDALSLSLKSTDSMMLALSGKSKANPALGFECEFRQLAVDNVFKNLRTGGSPPLRGGTLDLRCKGSLSSGKGGMTVDLPLQVALKDTTFALAGAKETKVASLLLPIGLRGPVTSPSVALDDKVLQDALLAAGQKELANFVQGQAGKLLGNLNSSLPAAAQGVIDPSKSPEQIAADAKKKAEDEAKKLEDEAKKKADAEKKRLEDEAAKKAAEEAKKVLPGGLKGLVPGGKK